MMLQIGWSWYPSVLIGFTIWTLLYVWASRSRQLSLAQQFFFHFGSVTCIFALVSPLDELGDKYLFSAHMVQHLLLLFVAPPLWLIGTSERMANRLIPKKVNKARDVLGTPIVCFGIFVIVLYFWHIPFAYQMTLENESIHIIEHLTFLGAGVIGWWPVAGPTIQQIPKPSAPLRILYLFYLAIPCTGLAAVLTFAHTPLYPYYIASPHLFGLDALQDQRLGGLLMWLPTHLVLLLGIGITFFSWFNRASTEKERDSNEMYIATNFDKSLTQEQELGV
jgi:putative membrane protein